MPFIDIINPDSAEGQLAEIYNTLQKKRGKIAEVHKIQSLNPASIVYHMDLYMHIMYGNSPLKRVVREMLGTVVSRANNCDYCVAHHAEAVNHYWKDDQKLELFADHFSKISLPDKELELCKYSEQLTLQPVSTSDGRSVEELKKVGLSDREILDATLVCAYFNFVNRIVLSLGVHLEEDAGKGYNYE